MGSCDTRGILRVNSLQPDSSGNVNVVASDMGASPSFGSLATYTPTTGSTIVLQPNGSWSASLILPFSGLLALTIQTIDGTIDGQMHSIAFGKAITVLSMSGSNLDPSVGFLTSPVLGQGLAIVWSVSVNRWFRCF